MQSNVLFGYLVLSSSSSSSSSSALYPFLRLILLELFDAETLFKHCRVRTLLLSIFHFSELYTL